MAGQNPGASNVNQFETYFQRADLDKDGRITGAEAVAFFQGSNLPKPVLAQIWTYADQNRAGFLGRQEFYNALKLVTVAQSKRDLTPDIVKAALYGPAAAKIPPPQINLSVIPSQQANPMTTASFPQMGATTPVSSQGFGFRGPGVPNASMPHQSVRPLQAAPVRPQGTGVLDFSRGGSVVGQAPTMSTTTAARPPQPIPAATPSPYVPTTSISSDWLGGNTGGAAVGSRSISPATSLAAPRPQSTVSLSSQSKATDSKSLVASGNGFASDSAFGGDAFAALSTTSRKEPFASTGSATGSPAFPTSASVPVSRGAQSLPKAGSLDSLQSALSSQSSGPPLQRTQSLGVGPQVSAHNTSPLSSSGSSVGVGSSAPDNAQFSWPKMKLSDIQKYMKVFMEVDTDRDGRITGEQARNLFLSWRLPREVLKQVWDLSDQDNDSMLSLREFCFALYLMERFREGRTLPATLPRNVMLDETLMSMTGQPNANYGNAGWAPGPGFGQQQVMGARPMTPPASGRPPVPMSAPNAESEVMSDQQMSRVPVLDDSFATQLDNGEEKRVQEAAAAGTKVDAPERVILDSREKIEFYRSKMQELVLYKSRCDNRLNEITERALADKREAETLSKKYEEKYKQVAEIASKLTIEEAKFRELQERKMELHQAIVAVERGGSADGILQVRADRIQSDLEELLKALTERCKKHNLDVKSSALIELPFGWQPGIQEEAAVWDEEWDKFEDEGFGNDLTINVNNASSSPNANQEKASQDGSLTPDSNVGDKPRNLMNGGARAPESESAYTHNEDELARSPHGSFVERAAPESPSREFSDVFRSTEADTETHRSFDESTWGAFDNDDTDSVWGFNAVSSKDFDSDKHKDIFGSPSGESTIQKKSPFTFDDSVPSTPLSRYGNSPPRFSDFDSFSRFDSFSIQDSSRFSPQPEKFSRFDSINSSKDFGGPERLTRFDSINSTKDFGSEKLARFDSINSTKDFGKSSFYSFDDDPFGSTGPFKVSSDTKSKDKF